MTSLAEAQGWLRERVDDGAACPCCTQYAKVYRRKINAGQAQPLIRMWRLCGTQWCHIPTELASRGHEESKLAYWGILEEELKLRDDGGRAGWWRITELGRRFVLDEVRLPKYARIYDGRCLGLAGEPQGIRDALGVKFNYSDLMVGI